MSSRKGILKGKVLDGESKEAIPAAKVKVSCEKITFDTIADLEGIFFISDLPKQVCKIDVSAVGYVSSSFSVEIGKDSSQIEFPLTLGIKLDSVKVDYTGSSIIYTDSLGNIKTAKDEKSKSEKK
jgi:hypothetical protein